MIAQWHHEEWLQYNEGRSLNQRIADYQDYLNEENIPSMFCLTDNQQTIGTAAIVACDMDGKEHLTPWVASVYVEQSQRGKGLGKVIMTQLMVETQKMNIKEIYLYTPDAVSFYEKLGWKVMEHCNYCGEDVTIMKFNLPA